MNEIDFRETFTDPLSIAAIAIWFYRKAIERMGLNEAHVGWHYGQTHKTHMVQPDEGQIQLWLESEAQFETWAADIAALQS